MSDEAFDPRALVLGKDVHPVELWSPGARVRIHVPAVPVAGTIIAGALGALAAGAVVAVLAFSATVPEQAQWGAIVIAAAAGAIWAARKFHEMFEEHDVTFDWTARRATFRHGRSSRIVPFDEIRGLVLMGLKTRHEPGEANVTTAISYTAYWCRLEADLAGGRALIIEGDPEHDPVSPRRTLDPMGSALARALDVGFRFEDYREMTAKEYFL
jgi:hypothetical protein